MSGPGEPLSSLTLQGPLKPVNSVVAMAVQCCDLWHQCAGQNVLMHKTTVDNAGGLFFLWKSILDLSGRYPNP